MADRQNWKVPKSFRLDRGLDERLTERAVVEGRSKSAVVSDAIVGYLEAAGLAEEEKEFEKLERVDAYSPAREALERVRELNRDR